MSSHGTNFNAFELNLFLFLAAQCYPAANKISEMAKDWS